MKLTGLTRHMALLVAFMVAQILLFSRLHINHTAFCFVFISVLISASPKNGNTTNLLMAFAVGLVFDIFDNTLGVSAFCSISLMFVRNYIYGILSGKNQDEILNTDIDIRGIGLYSFAILVFICSLFYTFLYYMISAPQWADFGKNLLHGVSSTLFTSVMIVAVNIIFFYKKKVA